MISANSHETNLPTSTPSDLTRLEIGILIYLAIPNLVFFVTWITPVGGIPAAVATIVACYFCARRKYLDGSHPKITARAIGITIALAAMWTALSGIGGIVPQS